MFFDQHHHYYDCPCAARLEEMVQLLRAVQAQGDKIMESQHQLAQDLTALTTQVQKIGTETTATLQKVTDLQNALNNAGGTTPEVDAAMAALKAQVQLVDDLIPDAPAPSPNPTPAGS
jgi:chromosome segregation ATPase